MTSRRTALIVALLAGLAVVGAGVAWDKHRIQPAALNAAEAADKPAAPADKDRTADGDAVRTAVKDFVTTFEKGDAKAMAALWTEEGEYVSGDGTTLHGRAASRTAIPSSSRRTPTSSWK